ncbi:uroporphyrinogen-III synthase [Celeribacter litoreus]|uniref:uroporphyrinogen-III synthase n=1 Tax=Celeribacter litoreus TaxID=2876714 RepID=UPI001CCF3DAC|nr:uroporphyrinogen-III synthase [Celeribacter litoreus]MCA0042175.1 uroporphyrinogen-III synthase [Celeribacter litoreus]
MTATVLITRPMEDARKLAAQLPDANVICAPVMEIVPLSVPLPEQDLDFLILTSRHAVPMASGFSHLPVVCVGTATARSAREAGFDVTDVFENADKLVAAVSEKRGKSACHLHGRHTRGDIAERLTAAGLKVASCVVYDQGAQPWSDADRDQIFASETLILPVYSPRTAKIVSKRLAEFEGFITMIAISEACVSAWSGNPPDRIVVAERPDGEAMLRAIASQVT